MRPLYAFSMMVVAICLVAPGGKARAADDKEMERLLDAISRVESRRDPNAVGDHGRAIGVYQIHQRYWQDGTRILGVDWKYSEASDPQKARQVVRAYLSYYGRGKSLLDKARIHNGGPRGHRLKATQKYALKIAAIMGASQSS